MQTRRFGRRRMTNRGRRREWRIELIEPLLNRWRDLIFLYYMNPIVFVVVFVLDDEDEEGHSVYPRLLYFVIFETLQRESVSIQSPKFRGYPTQKTRNRLVAKLSAVWAFQLGDHSLLQPSKRLEENDRANEFIRWVVKCILTDYECFSM